MTFWNLFVADLKSLLRNRMALFWFLLFPVVFMLIFGAVFSGNQQATFDVGVAAAPGDQLAAGIAAGLGHVSALKVHTGSLSDELEALKKGNRSLVIEIPQNATMAVATGNLAKVPVYYDKSQEQTGMMLYSIVSEVFTETERAISHTPRLLEAELKPYQTTPFRTIDFLLPGILAMALMQLGLFGSVQLLSLREQKVLKALGATPLPRIYVLGAEVLVRLLLSMVQLVLIIALGMTIFGVHMTGNWLAVLGIVVLGALTFTALGYMLTSFAKTMDAGQGLIQLVQFPMMFLSGIFFPLSTMPGFLKPVTKIMPLTYLGDALRQVMVGMNATAGYSLTVCLLVLAGWLVASMVLGVVLWRWE